MKTLLQALFGCWHERTSFPLTRGYQRKQTYVVCLSCGAEFDYDLATMRRGARRPLVPLQPDDVQQARSNQRLAVSDKQKQKQKARRRIIEAVRIKFADPMEIDQAVETLLTDGGLHG